MNLFQRIVRNDWLKLGMLQTGRVSVYNDRYAKSYPIEYEVPSSIRYTNDYFGGRNCSYLVQADENIIAVYQGIYGGNGARTLNPDSSSYAKWGRGAYNYVGEIPDDKVSLDLEKFRVSMLPEELFLVLFYIIQ